MALNWDIVGIAFSFVVMLVGYYIFSLKARRVNRIRRDVMALANEKNIVRAAREIQKVRLHIEKLYQGKKISDTQFLILDDLVRETHKDSRKKFVCGNIKNVPPNIRELLCNYLDDGVITTAEFGEFQKKIEETMDFDDGNKNKLERIVHGWMLQDRGSTPRNVPKQCHPRKNISPGNNISPPTSSSCNISPRTPSEPQFVPPTDGNHDRDPCGKMNGESGRSSEAPVCLDDIHIVKGESLSNDDGEIEITIM